MFHLFRMSPTRLSCCIVAAIASWASANVSAESLPQIRPALIGSGPGSLVNLIDTQKLFEQGQRDAWVMFEVGVAPDGVVFGSDFYTSSPDSRLLKNEVRRRLRHTKFIPAVHNHKRTAAWFAGTVVFVVAEGRPRLRVYANQELDEIARGADFVAPQLIYVQNRFVPDFPKLPTKAKRDDAAGVVKVRHSVDANGKTTNVQVISEPEGYEVGDYLKKVLPLVDFLPGYRNGRPTASTYTHTWWFGRTVGW